MEKDAGSEWSAQVTQLPAGDSEILEEKECKRATGKGDGGGGGGDTPPGAVSDALHLISSWCVCQEIVKIKSNADMK